MDQNKETPSFWRENGLVLIIFFVILAAVILTAGNSATFIYGGF